MRYGLRFGCRFGQPHDIKEIKDTLQVKWERCRICGKTFHWNKGYKGRINNVEYLKVHLRQFAQPTGPTKRAHIKLYQPEKAIIYL
jgi:hypothetical protein